ncbi:MAG: amidohydrolase family protein [Mycoplasmatales bacterium]
MIIKNAKLADEQVIDIEIEEGIITKVGSGLMGEIIYDLEEKYYISAGWIDAHSHAFDNYEFIGDDIDTIGVKAGVTTLIDAGTVGSDEIDKLANANDIAVTDVFSLLNISKIGIIVQDELSNLNNIDIEAFLASYKKYPNLIKGIKARMSGSVIGNNGMLPLKLAKEIQLKTSLPLMVHIGNPDPNLDDILKSLGRNDILTHCFHGKKSNILDNSLETKTLLLEAIERGMSLDIGHGTSSFSYKIYKRAVDSNIKFSTISTDIYRNNRIHGPVFNFATTISKFLNLGMSHSEIIDKITIEPAKIYNLRDRGQIKCGLKADFTIYEISNVEVELIDSEGDIVVSNQIFEVKNVMKNGQLVRRE